MIADQVEAEIEELEEELANFEEETAKEVLEDGILEIEILEDHAIGEIVLVREAILEREDRDFSICATTSF